MNRRDAQPPARDATHFVHGLSGVVVVVPGRVAAWLHANLPLDKLRTEVRGADPEVDHVLVAMSVAGLSWRSSVFGTRPRSVPELAPPSAWLSPAEVADQLSVTSRAITKACQSGRLPAERVGDRWWISRVHFEHYRAARQQRAV